MGGRGTESVCRIGWGPQILYNGGGARLQGVELEGNYYVTSNLQLRFSASFLDSEFLNDTSRGNKGDRLPMSSKWNGSLGVQYDFDMTGYPAFVRADYGFRDEFFMDDIDYVKLDGYENLDMRAGLQIDNLSIELFGTNLTNEDALTAVWYSQWGYRLTPRMVGVEVGYDF